MRSPRRPRPPLGAEALNELAMAYVARFATSRAKLERYLVRKLRERGWDGSGEAAEVAGAVAQRMAERRFVDDRSYAAGRARSLAARGYGPRRLDQALRQDGVDGGDQQEALDAMAEAEADAALRFAERRRLGPFAAQSPDPKQREKAFAAMIRAGHRMGIARAILACAPGEQPDFSESSRLC